MGRVGRGRWRPVGISSMFLSDRQKWSILTDHWSVTARAGRDARLRSRSRHGDGSDVKVTAHVPRMCANLSAIQKHSSDVTFRYLCCIWTTGQLNNRVVWKIGKSLDSWHVWRTAIYRRIGYSGMTSGRCQCPLTVSWSLYLVDRAWSRTVTAFCRPFRVLSLLVYYAAVFRSAEYELTCSRLTDSPDVSAFHFSTLRGGRKHGASADWLTECHVAFAFDNPPVR